MDKKTFLELVEKKKQKLESKVLAKTDWAKKLEEAALKAHDIEKKEREKEMRRERGGTSTRGTDTGPDPGANLMTLRLIGTLRVTRIGSTDASMGRSGARRGSTGI